MNDLETGKDKIKKICEILKNETLEPAKAEAQTIVNEAHEEAEVITQQAKKKAEELLKTAQQKIEQERAIFHASLNQSYQQGMESLRQMIEEELFNKELSSWVQKQTADPKVSAQLISVLVQAVEREGTSADFSALIPATISSEKVNAILAKNILEKLREKSVVLGNFKGGGQLRLHDRQIILDLTDQAIEELLAKYLHKDFRDILFKKDARG